MKNIKMEHDLFDHAPFLYLWKGILEFKMANILFKLSS